MSGIVHHTPMPPIYGDGAIQRKALVGWLSLDWMKVLVDGTYRTYSYTGPKTSISAKTSWHGHTFRITGPYRQSNPVHFTKGRYCGTLMLAWTICWTKSRVGDHLILDALIAKWHHYNELGNMCNTTAPTNRIENYHLDMYKLKGFN